MAINKIIRDDCISDIPFLALMDKAERDIILTSAIIKDYEKRHSLFREGDSVSKFMIIVSGWIKLYNITADGEEIVIDMLTRGDVIGYARIFAGTSSPFSAKIIEKAQVVEVPFPLIEQRVRANPVLAGQIMTFMTDKINRLWVENSHLSTMKAEQRLSCLLLRLSSRMQGTGGAFSLPYDKSIIASQLGVELSTLSRLFSKLGTKDVICKGSEIRIDNFAALSACCCSQCPIPQGKCAGRRMAYSGFSGADDEGDLRKRA